MSLSSEQEDYYYCWDGVGEDPNQRQNMGVRIEMERFVEPDFYAPLPQLPAGPVGAGGRPYTRNSNAGYVHTWGYTIDYQGDQDII